MRDPFGFQVPEEHVDHPPRLRLERRHLPERPDGLGGVRPRRRIVECRARDDEVTAVSASRCVGGGGMKRHAGTLRILTTRLKASAGDFS